MLVSRETALIIDWKIGATIGWFDSYCFSNPPFSLENQWKKESLSDPSKNYFNWAWRKTKIHHVNNNDKKMMKLLACSSKCFNQHGMIWICRKMIQVNDLIEWKGSEKRLKVLQKSWPFLKKIKQLSISGWLDCKININTNMLKITVKWASTH